MNRVGQEPPFLELTLVFGFGFKPPQIDPPFFPRFRFRREKFRRDVYGYGIKTITVGTCQGVLIAVIGEYEIIARVVLTKVA